MSDGSLEAVDDCQVLGPHPWQAGRSHDQGTTEARLAQYIHQEGFERTS